MSFSPWQRQGGQGQGGRRAQRSRPPPGLGNRRRSAGLCPGAVDAIDVLFENGATGAGVFNGVGAGVDFDAIGRSEGPGMQPPPPVADGWGGRDMVVDAQIGGGVRKCVSAKSKREESMNSQHSRKRTERLKKCTVVTPTIYIFGIIEMYWRWEKCEKKLFSCNQWPEPD